MQENALKCYCKIVLSISHEIANSYQNIQIKA